MKRTSKRAARKRNCRSPEFDGADLDVVPANSPGDTCAERLCAGFLCSKPVAEKAIWVFTTQPGGDLARGEETLQIPDAATLNRLRGSFDFVDVDA